MKQIARFWVASGVQLEPLIINLAYHFVRRDLIR
jgi:hypothetical protein